MLKQTPSQTVGPYFLYGLIPQPYGRRGVADNRLASPELPGEHIRIEGQVLDGEGNPIVDALIEVWQADAEGHYPAEAADGQPRHFAGFGRADSSAGGLYGFETVKPGGVAEGQAPHVNVIVYARGMLSHAFTRIYFSDEAQANAADPVLALVPEERRNTLIAQRAELPGRTVYRFDIRLQGEGETVFFDA
ncbi:protocatechuate 3,4-dioxygenase subunit alpha [Azospirillum sp. SYSU D00513]|uniref:protocatechuate 3,4-dioxygenase subunit alpha n=1 Tax=Azospirillum sp. SYSU D00513 TaxID=2812561 RepID=UPI001A96A7DD|nr:protocatechuate 3,4-dioxygenase subunit alpha [Azospirillum sp. SYSU D00513]